MRESGRVLSLIANPKRIASAAGVTPRAAEMWCRGERDNALGRVVVLMRALVSEGGRVWRAAEYLESEIMEAEMDVREVAPAVDYQAALQEIHDQMTTALPKVLAEICGEPNPQAMHETALDVAEAARVLMVRARQLANDQRAERRRKVQAA
jgi:hypothetical protein